MASWKIRQGTKFYWVKFRDETGKLVQKSTPFRIDRAADKLKLKAYVNELTWKESQTKAYKRSGDRFDAWVIPYLETRYAAYPSTLKRYRNQWSRISLFLEERKIARPISLTREDCQNYYGWRKAMKSRRNTPVHHNTVVYEIRTLGMIMKEAVKREFCAANPCTELGFKLIEPRQKPEISDDEIRIIRQGLANRIANQTPRDKHEVEFLRVSFEIALHQGCRISETYLDLKQDIDLQRRVIFFRRKGGKHDEVPMNEKLVPMFKELLAKGKKTTFEMGPYRPLMACRWFHFFREIGLPHLSSHCFRVTFISRAERAGTPEATIMRIVGHASTTVHRVYRRYHRRELDDFWPVFPE